MDTSLSNPALWSRLQFGFTLTYHYLFPQLTMGLAWFLVFWKWRAFRTGNEEYNKAARFWAKIFGLNFAVGVVTGIPMEFQFGTNWAGFSRYAGGVIGQTLAMESMFAFLLESAFIGALIWGEKRLGPRNPDAHGRHARPDGGRADRGAPGRRPEPAHEAERVLPAQLLRRCQLPDAARGGVVHADRPRQGHVGQRLSPRRGHAAL